MRKQLPGETNEYVQMRAADRSPWLRITYTLEKYKIVVYLTGMFLLALGFDFKFPSQVMHAQQLQINSNTKRLDSLNADLSQAKIALQQLLQLSCLDHKDQVVCQPFIPR